MTGYGKQRIALENHILFISIQTINSKGIDLHLEVPPSLLHQKNRWQKILASKLLRGRIDVTISFQPTGQKLSTALLTTQIEAYHTFFSKLVKKLHSQADPLQLTMEILTKNPIKKPINDQNIAQIEQALTKALEECITSRAQEGNHLTQQLLACLKKLTENHKKIKQKLPIRNRQLREKLEKKLHMRESKIDSQPWEQEILYLLEKAAIEEELVRLTGHFSYFSTTIEKGGAIGKKLGFILQEMIRETNTIGAKAQDLTLQHLVIEMKETLEQMKEQVRNIL